MPHSRAELGMSIAPGHPWFRLLERGLVELALPPTPTDGEVSEAFAELERWMSEVTQPYAFVIRIDGLFALSSAQRRIIADAEQRYEPVERRYNAGQAIVLKSAMQRGIFTAFTWIAPPVWPYRIFGDFDEAFVWLRAHFAEVTRDFQDGPRWSGRLAGRLSERRRPSAPGDQRDRP